MEVSESLVNTERLTTGPDRNGDFSHPRFLMFPEMKSKETQQITWERNLSVCVYD